MKSLLSTVQNRVSSLFGRAGRESARPPIFSELSPEDITRLDGQRAVIAAEAKQRYGVASLTRSEKDLEVLQSLLEGGVFNKSQTYQLQCLGVVFGDVLASLFPLKWVIVTDEYGSDPTLQLGNTSININALTMISKRVERDEQVNVFDLLQKTREALPEAERRSG